MLFCYVRLVSLHFLSVVGFCCHVSKVIFMQEKYIPIVRQQIVLHSCILKYLNSQLLEVFI